jgi:tetratricopeptide (TPR) repeat protein
LTLFNDEVISKQGEKINKVTEELSDEVSERIEELSEQGSSFFDDDDFEKAIAVWKQALALVPHPQNTYAETLWLESSIGDAYFMLKNYETSLHHFLNAKGNIETNAYENPFVMLRLGELYVEINNTADAKEYLLRAYMLEGEEIFEDEDDKYFGFLKTHVELK